MPGFPLFPGVLMCEAAAQMCGYYYVTQKVGDSGVHSPQLTPGLMKRDSFTHAGPQSERLVKWSVLG